MFSHLGAVSNMGDEEFAEEEGIPVEFIPHYRSMIATDAFQKYLKSKKSQDIKVAIEQMERATSQENSNHGSFVQWLIDLGRFYRERYAVMGEKADLDEAIRVAQRVLDATPDPHRHRTGRLEVLGGALYNRYMVFGDTEDLKSSIVVGRKAIESATDGHADRAALVNTLANRLQRHFDRYGDADILEEAVKLAREILESTAENSPNRAGYLNGLGSRLEARFELLGDINDLDEATDVAKQAADLIPTYDYYKAGFLANFAAKLLKRYEAKGERADIDEAIRIGLQAVELTPDGDKERAGRLINVSNFYQVRYESLGTTKDLKESIFLARQVVESTSSNHPQLGRRLTYLGSKLFRQYQRTGLMNQLKEAIDTSQQSIDHTPANHADRSDFLTNFGSMLQTRYKRTGEKADLAEAVRIARLAMESTPKSHAVWRLRSVNLAAALFTQYGATGEMNDLEEATDISRRALEATSNDDIDRPSILNYVAVLLGEKYDKTDDMVDLKEAIRVARQAVESTQDGNASRSIYLTNLAQRLQTRHDKIRDISDRDEALRLLSDAWNSFSATPFERLRAGVSRLNLLSACSRIEEGVDLGVAVLNLLPAVNTRLMDRNDQQFVLISFAGVASTLCALCIAANRVHEALEYLEQGRAVIISRLLDDHGDIASLYEHHPDIAERYQSLVDQVNVLPLGDVNNSGGTYSKRRQRKATEKLNALLEEIRSLDGHERFLLGQTVSQMKECAVGGTIVIVNITDFRSDAILISNHEITTIPLTELSSSDARTWLERKWTGKRSEQSIKNKEYLEYLSWLWRTCVRPVIDGVSATQKDTHCRPRIWWTGAGLASSMPFHAAGIHGKGSVDHAYGRALSSYTPSIKALAYAQRLAKRKVKPQANGESMIIVTMPTSPPSSVGKRPPKPLRGVTQEAAQIVDSVQQHIRADVLTHPSADDVLQGLQAARFAHFACHGMSDSVNPSNSGLILQVQSGDTAEQDRLTVQRISEMKLEHAQIAYLSACSTAENRAAKLSDEVIHAVSGFQVAGFPHVVGCLWPAGDAECVTVATRFYSLVLQQQGKSEAGGSGVALALQTAVEELRESDLSMPLNWAQFIHYGA